AAADMSGAVTSRMITSTSATSMIGVTLTFVMGSASELRVDRTSAARHGDRRRAGRLRPIEHVDERAVRDGVAALDEHEPRRAGLDERRERRVERRERHLLAVHADRVVREDRDLDAIGARR